MKKVLTVVFALLFAAIIYSQPPQKMSYQAVIRNSNGQLVTSNAVGLKISILQGSDSGTLVYTETQTPLTNENGLISIEIGGQPGFDAIDWSAGQYFIKTETDPTGGTNYTIEGVSRLLSVPYALYAKTAGNGFSGNYNDLSNLPVLFDGNYNSLTNLPVLFDGNYNSLTNLPALFDGSFAGLSGKPTTASGYGITDVMTTSHPANEISELNKTYWNLAHSWGNHAEAGYLKSFTELDPKVGVITNGYIPVWNGSNLVTSSIYQNPSGNIGIKTATATVPLDVNGIVQTSEFFKVTNSGNTNKVGFQLLNANGTGINIGVEDTYNTRPYITFNAPGNTTLWKMKSNGATYSLSNNYNNAFIALNSWDYGNGEVILGANGTENMRITRDGRVGISTISPSTALEVSGVITVSGSSTGNSNNWNLAYSWGNHADAGYSLTTHTHTDATNSVSGFMSAADKVKLDGYPIPSAVGDFLAYDGMSWVIRSIYSFAASNHGHGVATTATNGFMSSGDKLKLDGLTQADGSETKVTAGANIDVNGTGTAADPYVIANKPHTVGETYGGGVVFYVYDNGLHGLIAATSDASINGNPNLMIIYNGPSRVAGAFANGVGAGKGNTYAIAAMQAAITSGIPMLSTMNAAYAAINYSAQDANGVRYGDWYLPSQYEMILMSNSTANIPGYNKSNPYWSSTEVIDNPAYAYIVVNGSLSVQDKRNSFKVRPIRAF